MISHNLKQLIDKVNQLEETVRQIKSEMIAGQASYESSVISADYSHVHMPNSINSGSTASNITFTGTVTISGTASVITATSITIHNQGAGDDPVLSSNSAQQKISSTGIFEVSDALITGGHINAGNYLQWKCSTAFYGSFRHAITANRNYTFPDFTGNVLVTGGSIVGSITLSAGNLIMGGTGGDDERLQVPYLTGVPASVANGSVWMEADGLHIYYNGAEKVVAGT